MDVTRIEIAKLELQPGDTLVVKANGRLRNEQFDMLSAYVRSRAPEGVKVLLLDEMMSVEVLRNAKAQPPTPTHPATGRTQGRMD